MLYAATIPVDLFQSSNSISKKSSTRSKEVLSIAALGRPFHLGTLYDCRSDKIVSGITHWNEKVLGRSHTQRMDSSDFKIIASDTIDDKTFALDVKPGLKLSVLSGLVDNISGSGEYLYDRKSSSRQERITLRYKRTTKYEEMQMDQLSKMIAQYPEVFDHDSCTHIVTGIEYGGNAFFVFDNEISSSDKHVHGLLQTIVEKIPMMNIASGDLDLSDKEKEEIQKFSCKYLGDFLQRENPSSFKDVVMLFRKIQDFAYQRSNSVPVKVYLYPLVLLNSNASRFEEEIGINLVRELEKTFENLYELDIRCSDLLKSRPVQEFSVLEEEIRGFKSNITTYKLTFQEEMSRLLPLIRAGKIEHSKLRMLLEARESSPFSCNALKTWLKSKERDIKILEMCLSSLPPIIYVSNSGDLEAHTVNPDIKFVLCFTISIPMAISHKHLTKMSGYNNFNQSWPIHQIAPNEHADDTRKKICLVNRLRFFKKLYDENLDSAFLVFGKFSDLNDFSAEIECYKNGHRFHNQIGFPRSPVNVYIDSDQITHDGFTVRWGEEYYGYDGSPITHFEIVTEDLVSSKKIITQKTNVFFSRCHTVRDLSPNRKYRVSVQSRSEFGSGVEHIRHIETKSRFFGFLTTLKLCMNRLFELGEFN